jgi:hypothetical protein
VTQIPGDAYRVFKVGLSPKQGDTRMHRWYWQGPGTRTWGAGEEWQASAAQFPDHRTARAAVLAEWSNMPDEADRLVARMGYEFVPATIEHLPLFDDPKETP